MMSCKNGVPGLAVAAVLLVALSLSIGWGVRGNWGHEYGAMIPGALAAITACLVSGREDWRRRIAYFAFFGALGWSFGGSMSYGIVLGYTHSLHLPSVLYGFASIFLIGFLWGAIGGAGTALPAFTDRDRLTELFAPACAVFGAWALLGLGLRLAPLHQGWMDWLNMWYYTDRFGAKFGPAPLLGYDTDWPAALLAVVAPLLFSLVRRRWTRATSFLMHMAVGWWVGLLILVSLCRLHMTPPRSDNWAGVLGMTAGMFIYLLRNGLSDVAFVSLVTGLFAGFGFSTANVVKLMGVATGISTNWHSVLEQLFGFISGIGVAVSMGYVSSRAARVSDDPPVRLWTEPFSVCFTLLIITFLNIRKNVEAVWLPNSILLQVMYGIPAEWWFNMGYLAVAIVIVALTTRHLKQRVSVVPSSWLGQGQAFYLVFLWWIVIWNLARCTPFHPQRLVTEGVIHVNACICTALVLLYPKEMETVRERSAPDYVKSLKRVALLGIGVLMLCAAVQTAVVFSLFDKPPNFGTPHIRFGPNADFNKVTPSPP